MTMLDLYPVTCEKCGEVNEAPMIYSINLRVDTDLIDSIKKREINNYECPGCGNKHELGHDFLFVDEANGLFLHCYPEKLKALRVELEKEAIKSPVNDLESKYSNLQHGVVFGYDELLEKINLA